MSTPTPSEHYHRLLAPFACVATRKIDLTITDLTDKLRDIKSSECKGSEHQTRGELLSEFSGKYESLIDKTKTGTGMSDQEKAMFQEDESWLSSHWIAVKKTYDDLQEWRQEAEASLAAFELVDTILTEMTRWVDALPSWALCGLFGGEPAYRYPSESELTLHPFNNTADWEWEASDYIIAVKSHLEDRVHKGISIERVANDADILRTNSTLIEAEMEHRQIEYLKTAGPIFKSKLETLGSLMDDPDTLQADDCQIFHQEKRSERVDRFTEYGKEMFGEEGYLLSLKEAAEGVLGRMIHEF